jgi:hypothetical protein
MDASRGAGTPLAWSHHQPDLRVCPRIGSSRGKLPNNAINADVEKRRSTLLFHAGYSERSAKENYSIA